MATTSASCLKVKRFKDLEDIHVLLREFQQFEVVIGSSEETFRLAGIADSELDDLCEVHISRIPYSVSLAQLVRLCMGLNDSGGPASLVRLTLFINSSGISTGRATATYQNEEHAMSAELELNGAIITETGTKRMKIKTENWVLQTKPSAHSQPPPPPQQQQQAVSISVSATASDPVSASVIALQSSSSVEKINEEQTRLAEEQSAIIEMQSATSHPDQTEPPADPSDSVESEAAEETPEPAPTPSTPVKLQVALATLQVAAVPSTSVPTSVAAPVRPPSPLLEEGLIATTEMGRRLYVANIPKNKTQPDILAYFQRYLSGVVDVVLYTYPGSSQNRGFCFVEFTSTKKAMVAKEAIVAIRPWGCEVVVDWADPEQEPAEHVMKNVKVLYIKNIAPPTTEIDLRKAIEELGVEVERVKVIRDFGFVHFVSRERAEAAMEACRNLSLDGQTLKVSWAKPPLNKHMREEVLRRRERRMRRVLASRYNGSAVPFAESHLYESLADSSAFDFGGYSGNHGQGDY